MLTERQTDRRKDIQKRTINRDKKEKTKAKCLQTDRGKVIKEKKDRQKQKGRDEGEMLTEREKNKNCSKKEKCTL